MIRSNYNTLSDDAKRYFKDVLAFSTLLNSEEFLLSNNKRIIIDNEDLVHLKDKYLNNGTNLIIYGCEYDIDSYDDESLMFYTILYAISESTISKYPEIWQQRDNWCTNLSEIYRHLFETKFDKSDLNTQLFPFIIEYLGSSLLGKWNHKYNYELRHLNFMRYKNEEVYNCYFVHVTNRHDYSDLLLFYNIEAKLSNYPKDESDEILEMIIYYLFSKAGIENIIKQGE